MLHSISPRLLSSNQKETACNQRLDRDLAAHQAWQEEVAGGTELAVHECERLKLFEGSCYCFVEGREETDWRQGHGIRLHTFPIGTRHLGTFLHCLRSDGDKRVTRDDR